MPLGRASKPEQLLRLFQCFHRAIMVTGDMQLLALSTQLLDPLSIVIRYAGGRQGLVDLRHHARTGEGGGWCQSKRRAAIDSSGSLKSADAADQGS
jgi:hypothetical protein